MEQNSSINLGDALARMTRVLAALRAGEAKLARDLDALTSERKSYLVDKAGQLLPDLSARTRAELLHGLPTFFTPDVHKAFSESHSHLIFGFFPNLNYRATRYLMQTRLASHLDQVKYGKLEGIDGQIGKLAANRSALDARARDVTELIVLLQRAVQHGLPLTDEVKSQLERLMAEVDRGKDGKGRDRQARPRAGAQGPSASRAGDDLGDLWFYWATDIPTSLRTLLLEGLADHERSSVVAQDGGFEGAGSSGGWDGDTGEVATDSVGDVGAAIAGAAVAAAMSATMDTGAFGTASVAAAETFIATDDSLGAFS